MSRTAHKLLSASGGEDAYEIDQSLMFARADSAQLSWNPGSGATSYRKWTFSAWVKRSGLGTVQIIFGCYSGSGTSDQDYNILYFNSDDTLRVGAYTYDFIATARKFRDVGAWYHVCLVLNTLDITTASERLRLYINGVEETSFIGTTNYPAEDYNLGVLRGNPHYLGWTNSTHYYDGYLAEVYLIDSLPLTPSSFGETDSVTGQWIPKKYTGTYPGESVYLKFVSGAIGTDSSGNSNTWTASNLANADVMLDTPTNNFCTLNSLNNGSYCSLTQGNLRVNGNTTTHSGYAYGTFLLGDGTGKWYFESRVEAHYTGGTDEYPDIGWCVDEKTSNSTTRNDMTVGVLMQSEGAVLESGSIFTEQSGMDGTDFDPGDIFCLAVDMTNKKMWMGKNGTFFGSGNPAGGSNPTFTWSEAVDIFAATHNYGDSQQTLNFGQNGTFCGAISAGGNADTNGYGDFKHIPSGFKAICSKNLPTPTIKKPTEHFNTVLYTGSGAVDHDITGVGFQPDMTWIKARSQSYDHAINDSVRGAGKFLESNTTAVEEYNVNQYFGPFASDGFRLNDVDVGSQVNQSSQTYVSWNWKANGTGSSNSDGSVTVTTSANATAGFSMIYHASEGYFGGTYGHGLGKKPAFIITRDVDNVNNWYVWHQGFSNPTYNYLSGLNTTAAVATSSANEYNPTSTLVMTDQGLDRKGITYVWAEVEGFSKFGSYTGNGEAENGPYIYTGFSPALVIIKETSEAGGSWFMWDNKREVGNVKDAVVWADAANAETSHAEYEIDFLSNGFKLRGNSGGTNDSTETNLYMAWAESPFKYANAR